MAWLLYLGRWEIPEKNMWQGEEGKLLAAEAIDDVLRWNIPCYREAKREKKVELIQKHIIGQSSRTRAFFDKNRLYGMIYSSPYVKKRSVAEIFRLYDEIYQLQLFDTSFATHLSGAFIERK